MQKTIIEISDKYNKKVTDILKKEWGSSLILSKDKKYYVNRLHGFIILKDNKIKGIITYYIKNKKCEVITLNSFEKNKDIVI